MIDTALTKSEKAIFSTESPKVQIPVDFNPVTLQLTVQNKVEGAGDGKVQHVSSSSAKLDLELIFDSTDTGEDVRQRTSPIENLMKPDQAKIVSQVKFEWGAFLFQGVIESFKQTLEFFSHNGVPLRAVVALSLSQPEYQFDRNTSNQTAKVDDTLDLPGGDPSSLAAAGGDPFAARAIASANGLESLRASAQGSVSVGGGIVIGAAAGFSAGAGAGFGLGAGASAGLSAGAGATAGANLGVSLGGGADAGAGASFAELRSGATASSGTGNRFRVDALVPVAGVPALAAGAEFDVNGKAIVAAGSSFKADVTGGVRFDEV